MATDPKALANATQQIEKHLENYAKRREVVSKQMQQAHQRMQAIDKIVHGTESRLNQMISDLARERLIVEGVVQEVGLILEYARKPAPEYEQVQRRYLDGRKTNEELRNNWLEKKEAFEKKRGDPKAAGAFELAEKAYVKADHDFQQLALAAQELINSKSMRHAERLATELPDLLHRYEEALKELMTGLGAESKVRSLNSLLVEATKK